MVEVLVQGQGNKVPVQEGKVYVWVGRSPLTIKLGCTSEAHRKICPGGQSLSLFCSFAFCSPWVLRGLVDTHPPWREQYVPFSPPIEMLIFSEQS